MSGFLNQLMFASAVMGTVLGVVACSDDDANENKKPEVYLQIEAVWNKASCTRSETKLACSTSCPVYEEILKDHLANKSRLEGACKEYTESLAKFSNKPERLARDPDNAGYYLSAYMMMNALDRSLWNCGATDGDRAKAKADWEKLISETKCTEFRDHSKLIAEKRGE